MKEFLKKNLFYDYCVVAIILLLGFLCVSPFSQSKNNSLVLASEVKGTIDNVYKYARGVDNPDIEINFKFYGGSFDVVVTDTEIGGFAWGNKIGWINFSPSDGGVQNDTEGKLSGFATSEFGGWLDFNGVSINSAGEFTGYATSQNFGKIIFNCSTNNSCATKDFKVKTDWRPVSVRNGTTPRPIEVLTQTTPPVSKESPSAETKNTETKEKPLPVGDTSQYQGGGDVVVENKSTEEKSKGQTTKILTPEEQNIKIGEDVPTIPADNNPAQSEPDNSFLKISSRAKIVSTKIVSTTKEIRKEATVVAENNAVNISTKAVSTAGVVGGGTVLATTFASTVASLSEFFLTFFRLWSIILSALGLRKKREPWGTVYDSITKQPLDPAYVILQDKKGNEVATSITDLDGRFGFLVPPGKYQMVVKKTNYLFPSSKLFNKYNDELYNNLYFGEIIETEENKAILKNIPMDPKGFDWNEFEKTNKKLFKFNSKKIQIIAQVSRVLFYFGLFLSLGLLAIKPDIYNIAMVFIYGVLIFIRRKDTRSKSFGTITHKDTGLPVSFAIVRVFEKNEKKETFHRVADGFGHYYCLLPKGEYYLTIEKKNSDESYSKIYTSGSIFAKKGIINQDFSV